MYIVSSVTKIGGWAFYGCDSLESITLPFVGRTSETTTDNVEYVGPSYVPTSTDGYDEVFGYIFGYEQAKYSGFGESVDGAVEQWVYVDTSNLTRTISFWYYIPKSLKKVVLSEGLTEIGPYEFYNCVQLTDIVIPVSVTAIEEYAFDGIDTLENVYISDLDHWVGMYFGDNPLTEGGNLYLNGEIVTSVVIPDGYTTAGDALGTCSTITSIQGGADEVLSLATVSVSTAYKLIITSGTLDQHGALSTSQQSKLSDCSGLVEIEIRNGVTIEKASSGIGGVFYKCDKLEKATIDAEQVPAYAFYKCASLKYVVLGSNVRDVASTAFNSCNLTCVYNYSSCSGPSAKATYNYNDGYLLSDDGYITMVSDGKNTLYHYIGLDAAAVLPKDINNIAYHAFAENESLTCVTIGTGVERIESGAFYGCASLATINYDGTIEQWNAIEKQSSWDSGIGYAIYCSDGIIANDDNATE